MTVVAVVIAVTDGKEKEEDQDLLSMGQGRGGANRNQICILPAVTIAQESGRTDIRGDVMKENGIGTEARDGVIIGGRTTIDLLDATETYQMRGPEEVGVEIAMHSVGVGSGRGVRAHRQKRENLRQI